MYGTTANGGGTRGCPARGRGTDFTLTTSGSRRERDGALPLSDVAAFAQRVESIIARSCNAHARFGIAVHALADGAILFERDAQFYFQGASTTKIPTVASALAALGGDFRFRTVVRHTGQIDAAGTLDGDLVLVAAGDPNLSARVRPDDTLAFSDVDHTISGAPGARAVPGDPLAVLRTLAHSVVAHGIARITGRVCIDVTIFPEGFREPGTLVVLSPVVINDNVIDITAVGGSSTGEPVELRVSPVSAYVSFHCDAITSDAGCRAALMFSGEQRDSSGARSVRIGGSLPPGTTQLYAHPVESPSAFARTAFVELLEELGVSVATGVSDASEYTGGTELLAGVDLAEHISPPFAQAAKVILKVSQNLHAELCPRVVGAVTAGVRGDGAEAAGFAQLAAFLRANAIDTDGIIQGDACGMYGYYTPDFMCRFLRAVAAHPIDPVFRACLPIMGRDGTLHDIATASAAAGHVVAKTGTHGCDDRLAPRVFVIAKGLAGYIEAASGRTLVFTAYANCVALEPGQMWSHVGGMLGEIAAAAYDTL